MVQGLGLRGWSLRGLGLINIVENILGIAPILGVILRVIYGHYVIYLDLLQITECGQHPKSITHPFK